MNRSVVGRRSSVVGRRSSVVGRRSSRQLLDRRDAERQAEGQQRPGRQLHPEIEVADPQQQRAGRRAGRAQQRRPAAQAHRRAQPDVDGQHAKRAQQGQQRREGRQGALAAQQHRHALEDREAQRHTDLRWVANQVAQRARRRLGDARQRVVAQVRGHRQIALGVPALADRRQVAVVQQRQHADQQCRQQQRQQRPFRAQHDMRPWPRPAPPGQDIERRGQCEQQRQRPAQVEGGADADVAEPDRERVAGERCEQRGERVQPHRQP